MPASLLESLLFVEELDGPSGFLDDVVVGVLGFGVVRELVGAYLF